MPKILIYRQEYDYANVQGLGILDNGDLIIVKKGEPKPELPSSTRIINNPKVPDAFSAPIKIFLDPSTQCPLSCLFCLSDSSKQSTLSISKEKILDYVQQIIDMGVLRVKVGGGEPFVYPYFYDIVEKLHQAGIFVSCSTSGILIDKLTEAELKFFAENKVKISISIDGDEQYHDKLRNKQGLFQKAVNAVKVLKKAQNNVELRATIANNSTSYEQIQFLNDLSQNLKTKIRIRTVKPKGRAIKNKSAALYPTEAYWKFFDHLRLLAQKNPLINIEEMLSYDKPTGYSVYGCKLDCAAGTRSAYIDANGRFCPCGFVEQYFPSVVLSEQNTLQNLWHSGHSFLQIRKFFNEQNQHSPCANCAFVNSCQGGCPSVRLMTKTLTDPRCPLQRKEKR